MTTPPPPQQPGSPDPHGQAPPAQPQSYAPPGGHVAHGGGGEGNGVAIAALVVGLLAILGAFLTAGVLGIILGIVAIILGVQGRRKVASGRTHQHRGLATGGLVTGIIGLLLGLLFVILIAVGVSLLSNSPELQQEIEKIEQQQP